MTMITMKMNVIDSTESTDTMTFINNKQSIIVNIVIVYFLKFVLPLTSTWPHLNSDVGLEKGEY